MPSVCSLCLLAIVVMICPGAAFAACPVPTPPCESMRTADLVFYGEVVRATASTHGDQKVTFRVVRPFKGVGDARFTGAFRITRQGVYFVAGERRVVYASAQGKGGWSTSCARTALVLRPADQEAADLAMCEQVERSPRRAGVKERTLAPRRR